MRIFFDKHDRDLIVFALSAIEDSINAMVFEHKIYHILTAELYHPVKSVMKNCINLKHVISIPVKITFHDRQSAKKWLKNLKSKRI